MSDIVAEDTSKQDKPKSRGRDRFSLRTKNKAAKASGSQITSPSGGVLQTPSMALEETRASFLDPEALGSNSSLQRQSLGPIRELWNEAYEELKSKEESLVKDYEALFVGNLSAAIVGLRVGRKDLMKSVVEAKMIELKRNTWRLKFGQQEVALKDLAEPVVSIMKWADKYIGEAVSASPAASIAWAGIVLLMPLALNSSKQAASLAKGLELIANIIVRSDMREDLYYHRWECKTSTVEGGTTMRSHRQYRDTLMELYFRVLKFQAICVCYCAKNGLLQFGRDIVKWDKWDTLLADIELQENEFCSVYGLMKDAREEEKHEAVVRHHYQTLNITTFMADHMAGLSHAIEATRRDKEREELLAWLSSMDPSKNLNAALEKHEPGTGNWLIKDNETFQNWETEPNSLMWLNGKAGSGKSILSSTLITHLRELRKGDPESLMAYFYFSFNEAKESTATAALCSLIKQLCCCRPDTPKPLQDLREYKTKGQRPDLRTLENLLLVTIAGFSNVYVVLDALDECPDLDAGRETLLAILRRVHLKGQENLHMFWTSRRVKDIERNFCNIASPWTKVDMDLSGEREAMNLDIASYIDNTLSSESYAVWPTDLKEEARVELIRKADGMFQYVSCQFQALRLLKGRKKIKEALLDLPKGLYATYDRMLISTSPENGKQVANVLKWLAFSLRPLLLEEVAEIFILDPDAEMPFDKDERLLKPEAVLDYLSGLVTEVHIKVDDYDKNHFVRRGNNAIEIRLAHFSIKEYLVSKSIFSGCSATFGTEEVSAHIEITTSCLAYHLQLSQTILATEEIVRDFFLWEYIVRYWPQHFDMLTSDEFPTSLKGKIIESFAPNSRSLLNMARIRYPDNHSHEPAWNTEIDQLTPPLYHAASIDSLQLAQLLLDGHADVDAQGGKYGNALQAAAIWRSESIVQLLLERGAAVNAQGGIFGNALQAVAFNGSEGIVQLLLDRGAAVNVQGGYFGNALQAAAFGGSESIVQLLLDRGAAINVQGGHHGNALQAAAFNRSESIVQLLLDRSANVNIQGGYFGNALQDAVARDQVGFAELLLARGAKVNPPGEEWDEFIAGIEQIWGKERADRLRKFQKKSTEYLAERRKEKEEEKKKRGW